MGDAAGSVCAQLQVEVVGNGPPLVLLHGWAMHGGIFAPLVDALREQRTLHVVDLPGHGNNRDCGVPLELDACARAVLDAVPDALNLCTAPGHEGQGLGQRMLQALLRIARGHGAQRVFLEVRPSNPRAIKLYDRSGFNEIGRRPRYYPAANNGREDAIVMAMELLTDDISKMPPL